MPLTELHRAVAEHTGAFHCERIHKPLQIKR